MPGCAHTLFCPPVRSFVRLFICFCLFLRVFSSWADDKEKQDAIQRMTELTVAQENIVPVMKANDLQVMEAVVSLFCFHLLAAAQLWFCLSALSTRLSVCLFVCLSVCLSFCLSVCLSVCLQSQPQLQDLLTTQTTPAISTDAKRERGTNNANIHPDPVPDFNACLLLLSLLLIIAAAVLFGDAVVVVAVYAAVRCCCYC